MVGFVLVIGLLNLALGYGLALGLAEPPFAGVKFSLHFPRPRLRWPNWQWPKFSSSPEYPHTAEEAAPTHRNHADAAAVSIAEPAGAVCEATVEELPKPWLDQLAAAEVAPESFVEAAMHVLRLDVTRYREQLLVGEWRARQALGNLNAAALLQLRDDMRVLNEDWLQEQILAATVIGQRRGRLGAYEQAGTRLEHILLDQAAQIKAMCHNIATLDFAFDPQQAGQRLLVELMRMIDLAHVLRDQIQETFVIVLKHEDRLDTTTTALQTDATTGLLNRVGVEVLLHQWWHDDPDRARLVSLVLVDIDRFGRLNDRFGTRTGDRALHSFGKLLSELIRRGRGFDRIGRLAGQSFLLFLGDTGPHHATSAIERIRQTIEATTFDYEGNEFELTISCGVISVGKEEQLAELLERGVAAVREAKKGGRNRTSIDEGQGPEFIDPPTYQVKGHLIPVVAG